MSHTAQSVSLLTLVIPTPSKPDNRFPTLGNGRVLQGLHNICSDHGWQYESHQLLDGNEPDYNQLKDLIKRNIQATNIVLISAHGYMIKQQAYFYCTKSDFNQDTSPSIKKRRSIEVEDLLAFLKNTYLDRDLLVIIDACEVDLYELANQQVPVLLAAPNDVAVVSENGGHLSETFSDCLNHIQVGQTWRDLLAATKKGVENRATGQIPVLKRDDLANFLNHPILNSESVLQASSIFSAEQMVIKLALNKVKLSTDHELALDLLKLLRPKIEQETYIAFRVFLPEQTITSDEFHTLRKNADRLGNEDFDHIFKRVFYNHAFMYLLKLKKHPNSVTDKQYRQYIRTSRAGLQNGCEDLENDSNPLTKTLLSQVYDQLAGLKVGDDNPNWLDAIEMFERSIKIKEEINDHLGIEMSRGQLALCYFNQNKLEEAVLHLREGLRICQDKIDSKKHPFKTMFSLIESVAFHAARLINLYLIVEHRSSKISELRKEINALIKRGLEICEWTGESSQAIAQVKNTFNFKLKFKSFNLDQVPKRSQKLWRAYLDYRKENGPQELQKLRQELVVASDQSWENRLDMLAIASTCLSQSDKYGQELLQLAIDQINQNKSFHINGSPWYLRTESLDLHTQGWWDWGPMSTKLDELSRYQSYYHFQVTEQFLQSLFWCQAICVLMECNLSIHGVLNDLFEDKWQGKVSLTLSTCYTFAQVAMNKAKSQPEPKRQWLKDLINLWTDQKVIKESGFNDLHDFLNDRNDKTHNYAATFEEIERTIKSHSYIIKEISECLNKGVFGWEIQSRKASYYCEDQESVAEMDMLNALIVKIGEKEINCSPLIFQLSIDDSSGYYVPSALTLCKNSGRSDIQVDIYRRGLGEFSVRFDWKV